MKNKFLIAISLLCSASFWSCTDLEETYYDQVSPNNVPKEILVSSIYSSLKGDYAASPRYCPFWLYVYTVQASTDELVIPTCGDGKDWYDQGIYMQMQLHEWYDTNPIFESCWSYLYKISSVCNDMLSKKDQYMLDGQSEAECRLLRAYAYYRLMDLFGDVPIITEQNMSLPQYPLSSRKEVFEFVENELNDPVMLSLKQKRFAKMDKGIWHTLKARLYLNSKVFLGLDDESSVYKAYLEKCIVECDSVINSGVYSIESNIYKNFYVDNSSSRSKENIFVIEYNNDGSTLGNRMQMSSYFKTQNKTFGGDMYQHTTGGWKLNPGKTADDPDATFNLFSKYDNRRLSILWGQQYDAKTSKVITAETQTYYKGKRVPDTIDYRPFFTGGMSYEVDQPGVVGKINYARSGDGARIIKFELEADPKDYESGVDMVVMRYAEVLYMKAECLIRLGKNADAVPLFKQVLDNRGYDYDNQESFAKTLDGKSVKYDYTKDEGKDATWSQALMSKRWLDGHIGKLTEYDKNFKIPENPDLKFMDEELRREFLWEDHRRTDMIRMGKFTGVGCDFSDGTWGGHTTPTGKGKEVFPIPAVAKGSIIDAK